MTGDMIPTQDPYVWIEERRSGYVRYRRDDGRRWEVHGECIGLGHCIVGSVIDGHEVKTLEEAKNIWKNYDFPLDSPVTPEFTGCCPFTFTELESVQ